MNEIPFDDLLWSHKDNINDYALFCMRRVHENILKEPHVFPGDKYYFRDCHVVIFGFIFVRCQIQTYFRMFLVALYHKNYFAKSSYSQDPKSASWLHSSGLLVLNEPRQYSTWA